ncbi:MULTISPECIES: hypothetical protein [unclassified Streptomyces]|uniref:hypothetical protein n=1 Tax=unclassified Streptomyces TaxID=2593676 RepID=UPI0004C8AF8E|nr:MULTISPECIES: hypothetical protein [unclassified Streptomyces]KOV98673.1 hypothetical protein ADL02_06070 [Streptomyces sp. NRRL WC-3723]
MTQTLPPLTTEPAALSVAGAGLLQYEVGPVLIGAGADATVVIVTPGDNVGGSGVQDSAKVLLHGDFGPALHPRFEFQGALPVHLFVRLGQGCLPLGTARCRASAPAHLNHFELELDQPLSRVMLDAVRPVPAPGPVPGVEWVDLVETDPIKALESFVLGWFPAEETKPAEDGSTAGEPGSLPESLAAFHRLARLRPALYRFHDPVLKQPERAHGPLGDRLVFAVWNGASMDWSIPWPSQGPDEADPPVWHTEDPDDADPETILEEEPMSRFLLQFTLFQAQIAAPYHARTYSTPTARLDALWNMLRPVPLSPFLPTYEAEKFFVAPGLLAMVSSDENETVVSFGALHRGTLTPLLAHGFHWFQFDG